MLRHCRVIHSKAYNHFTVFECTERVKAGQKLLKFASRWVAFYFTIYFFKVGPLFWRT